MARIAKTIVLTALLTCSALAEADAEPMGWVQPQGPGTPVVLTYSYTNLFDGTFLLLNTTTLRAATEEALRLWARHAPLHFVERPDSGPAASDAPYPASDFPMVRIGHHPMQDVAHAFFPDSGDGLSGDVHLDSGGAWTVAAGPWNILEALAHELGHALGVGHITEGDAIMNPFYPQARFAGLGSGFLLPPDISRIQALYGAGAGSVTPLDPVPEPGTLVLVALGLGLMTRLRR